MRHNNRITHRVPEITNFYWDEVSGLYFFYVVWNPKGSIVNSFGIAYSTTNPMPDLDDSVLRTDAKVPYNTVFGYQILNVLPGTYYVRGFARNIEGYAWSSVIVLNIEVPADIPSIETVTPFAVYAGSAKSGGVILNDGGGAISSKGVCFNTTGTPDTGDSTTSDGSGMGDFESRMAPLNPSTLYYVRAYATNSAGTGYGDEETFTTTAATVPIVNIRNAGSITESSIVLYGEVLDNGGSVVTSRGFVWNLTGNPTYTDNFTSATGTDASFSALISGLPSGVIIYMKAVAQNTTGWGLSTQAEVVLSASGYPPDVEMVSIGDIRPTYVAAYGDVTFDGGSPISERGFLRSLTSVNPNPQIGGTGVTKNIVPGTTGAFSGQVSGLTCGSNYSINAYAMNANGVGYGEVLTATTGSITLPVFEFRYSAVSPCGSIDLLVTNTYAAALLLRDYLQCPPVTYETNMRRVESVNIGNKVYEFGGGCVAGLTSCYRVWQDGGTYYIIHIDANGIIDLKE